MNIKITSGSERVRIDSLEKFLVRNPDAILVKLEGVPDQSMDYKPGHLTRIEETDDGYPVFVGKHFIGNLPQEAISFAKQADMVPEFLVSMVGKYEDGSVSIYVAE